MNKNEVFQPWKPTSLVINCHGSNDYKNTPYGKLKLDSAYKDSLARTCAVKVNRFILHKLIKNH